LLLAIIHGQELGIIGRYVSLVIFAAFIAFMLREIRVRKERLNQARPQFNQAPEGPRTLPPFAPKTGAQDGAPGRGDSRNLLDSRAREQR